MFWKIKSKGYSDKHMKNKYFRYGCFEECICNRNNGSCQQLSYCFLIPYIIAFSESIA